VAIRTVHKQTADTGGHEPEPDAATQRSVPEATDEASEDLPTMAPPRRAAASKAAAAVTAAGVDAEPAWTTASTAFEMMETLRAAKAPVDAPEAFLKWLAAQPIPQQVRLWA